MRTLVQYVNRALRWAMEKLWKINTNSWRCSTFRSEGKQQDNIVFYNYLNHTQGKEIILIGATAAVTDNFTQKLICLTSVSRTLVDSPNVGCQRVRDEIMVYFFVCLIAMSSKLETLMLLQYITLRRTNWPLLKRQISESIYQPFPHCNTFSNVHCTVCLKSLLLPCQQYPGKNAQTSSAHLQWPWPFLQWSQAQMAQKHILIKK